MTEVKLTTVEEVNEQLKSRLGELLFSNYSPDTDTTIQRIFNEVAIEAHPQTLELEDVKFFEHDLKIEYQCQNRHYTMILSCKK